MTDGESTATVGPSRFVLTGWAAVVVLGLGAAVAQAFGRFSYGVLLPAIRNDLAVSNTVVGTIGTINVGAYLLGTILSAVATSRLRLLAVLRIGFVFSTAGLALAAVSPDARVLAVALFLTGIGGACIWIPTPAIAADAVAPERRSLVVGLMGSGIGAGIVFSGQLSAAVRSRLGDTGWRTVYAIEAGVAVAVLAAVVLLIGHHQARPRPDDPARRPGLGGFGALRRMPGWLPLTLAYTAFGLMYLLVLAFLTVRLEDDSGWTESESGLAFTLLGLAVIPGGVALISVARRIGTGRALALGFVLWGTMALLILPGWYGPTLAFAVGIGLVFSGIPGLITAYVVANTTAEDYGPAFAAATLAFGVAQMLSPQIGGALADAAGSFTPVFVLSSIMAVVGAGAALRLRH